MERPTVPVSPACRTYRAEVFPSKRHPDDRFTALGHCGNDLAAHHAYGIFRFEDRCAASKRDWTDRVYRYFQSVSLFDQFRP
jgi:hypothetical protein